MLYNRTTLGFEDLFTMCKSRFLCVMIRPVTSLVHQEGRRVFQEGSQFFELCPIFLNCVQHTFPEGEKKFVGVFASSGYGRGHDSTMIF